jgi:hypothetical protein
VTNIQGFKDFLGLRPTTRAMYIAGHACPWAERRTDKIYKIVL